MIHYEIDRIQIVKPNVNGDKMTSLDVNVSVTDLEGYRFHLMQEHEAKHIFFRYESINDRDKHKK